MKYIALVAIALIAGCATVPDDTVVENGAAAPMGTVVALGQPVRLDPAPQQIFVVTPMKLLEDSRCPINARCVWAGRVVVETRVDGAGWQETVAVEMGKDTTVRGERVTLSIVKPDRVAGEELNLSDYRFGYDINQILVGGD